MSATGGTGAFKVFRTDGTFVKETTLSQGAPWDIEMSRDPQQRVMFIVDGGSHAVYTMLRDSLEIVARFGHRGRWAGQFESPDNLALDSKGNLFVAETLDGRRLQKFVPKR